MDKNVREQIVDLLIEIERDKSYAQLAVKEHLQNAEPKDKGFITEIVYGTLKYQLRLDYIINSFSKTPVNKMKPLIRNLIRMSIYQMFYLDKVPTSAIINEAVKITKKRKFQTLSGFINGVLRNIDRNRELISYPNKEKEPVRALSILYSIPEWIITEWLSSYTLERVESICKALNERAKVCIRVNHLKATNEEVEVLLEAEGVEIEKGKLLDSAFYIKNIDNLQGMSSFKEGKWTVQDESAMLVANVVAPKPGECVLDLCSAPGGKSIHMAELMENKGKIVSCDIHAHKLELIAKNAERMGCTIIVPTLQDGTQLNKDFIEGFDKVLLDAPCSGLGIMKRKPDIRYSKSLEDLKEIAKLQKELAKQAVKYLKPDGTLVYSTCTISRAENEEIAKYIVEVLGLELTNIVDTIPDRLGGAVVDQGMIQILPDMADTDGFFIASFRKRKG